MILAKGPLKKETNSRGKLVSSNSLIKKAAAVGTLPMILGLFMAVSFIGAIGYTIMTWTTQKGTENTVSQLILKVSESVTQYRALGPSCTGFTMANAAVKFTKGNNDFVYDTTSSSVSMDDGNIVATADCSNPPGVTGLSRVGLTISGLTDDVCFAVVSFGTNEAKALQVTESGTSTPVIIKNYEEKNPTGRAALGVTACKPEVESDVKIWLG
ncbi:hypothetical protein [Marinomonas sp. 2405UD68-3]|uniref:hypothetical protein n=1 Tax=Marinomonas sp. 2405UD68-3 TaxID=3391835 RepID=UPI0039C935F3